MVTTERPAISFTAVMQARVASPSIWTVQAPHSATPQPYFVPMSPSSSRKYQSSGIDGSPSNDCSWPLTRNLTMGVPPRVKLIAVILSPKRWPSNTVNRQDDPAERSGRLGKKSMVGWIGAVRPSRRPLSRPPQDEELLSMPSKPYPHPE